MIDIFFNYILQNKTLITSIGGLFYLIMNLYKWCYNSPQLWKNFFSTHISKNIVDWENSFQNPAERITITAFIANNKEKCIKTDSDILFWGFTITVLFYVVSFTAITDVNNANDLKSSTFLIILSYGTIFSTMLSLSLILLEYYILPQLKLDYFYGKYNKRNR